MPFCFGPCNSAADCEPGCSCSPSGFYNQKSCKSHGSGGPDKPPGSRRYRRGAARGGRGWQQGGIIRRKSNFKKGECPKGYQMINGNCQQAVGNTSIGDTPQPMFSDCEAVISHHAFCASQSGQSSYPISGNSGGCQCNSYLQSAGGYNVEYTPGPDGEPATMDDVEIITYHGNQVWVNYCTSPYSMTSACSGGWTTPNYGGSRGW